ncbi:MAG: hypothetical protein M9904_02355 [Chitinophagaceae bacterium]|nr:hypothetical protein [Chitinophagaceae bacterium]
MLKFGIICDIKATEGMARVYFREDGVTTNWLPISVLKSLNDKFIYHFDINEHVWCIMDEHNEYGVIAGAIYSKNEQPQSGGEKKIRFHFADNSFIEYDGNTKTLTIDCKGDIKVTAKNVDVECEQANIDASGDVSVSGNNIEAEAVVSAKVTAPSVEVKASAMAKITAPEVTVDALTASFTGALSAASIATTGGGAIETAGEIMAQKVTVEDIETDNAVIGGKDFLAHTHTAPSGGGATSPPL